MKPVALILDPDDAYLRRWCDDGSASDRLPTTLGLESLSRFELILRRLVRENRRVSLFISVRAADPGGLPAVRMARALMPFAPLVLTHPPGHRPGFSARALFAVGVDVVRERPESFEDLAAALERCRTDVAPGTPAPVWCVDEGSAWVDGDFIPVPIRHLIPGVRARWDLLRPVEGESPVRPGRVARTEFRRGEPLRSGRLEWLQHQGVSALFCRSADVDRLLRECEALVLRARGVDDGDAREPSGPAAC